MEEQSPARRLALISDQQVWPLHGPTLEEHLQDAGFVLSVHRVEAGEHSKSLEVAGRLYEELLDARLDRSSAIVALGGGVVGDLSGFVASTLLRGIHYFQIPTSTLAAVDSSVGGKTAVNTPQGKNLIGTFHPPRGVFVCASHLATQSRRQHAAGLAEAVKMAATLDKTLFEDLKTHADRLLVFDPKLLLPILDRAVALKAQVVSRDEQEKGERAVLNYGHSIGHAIEVGENFALLHGEAVALGMVAEGVLAEQRGVGQGVAVEIRECLQSLGLPVDWRRAKIDTEALIHDKKRVGEAMRLPVISRLGSYEFQTLPVSALTEFIKRRSA